MKSLQLVATTAMVFASLVFGGCDDTVAADTATYHTELQTREPAPDGEPCDLDEECESGACVPTLPEVVSPRGVCWGPEFHGCVQVLIFDTWAEKPCTAFGMTVAICDPVQTPEMNERCKTPTDTPQGEYPYEFTCCETTFFE
jgi:hypothetical protein